MKKKILITGGGGFIGGHLANFYHKKGFKVISVDLKKKNLWFQLEGKDYVNVNKCEDRTKVYLKANEAIEEGYNFYLNENNFVISSGKNNMIPPKFLVVAN